ncbi:MAG: pitrilysin family protein [Pseudomonadota bacterium]
MLPSITSSLPAYSAIAFAAALLMSGGNANAQTLPKGVEKLSTVEGITEYRLPNGLKVLLLPDASKPTVAVNITYLVGSRHENYGETGMAHLLEHLMFKGTPKHADLPKEFSARGFRNNGSTTLDRTNYFELFKAGDADLQWAIQMEADRMVNSHIAKKDLDTEMTVVRNEFEKNENNPFGVLVKRTQSVAYDWHNYAKSTIGNRSDIENVKIENLQAFYRTHYQPDNAVLMIAGKFDPAKALEWTAKSFGVIPKPKRVLAEAWTVEPAQDGERNFAIRRKGDMQIIFVAYRTPSQLHKDSLPLNYASSILASQVSGRLHKQLVESGKAVAVMPVVIGSYAPSLRGVIAVVKKGEAIEPVREALIAGIENFAKVVPSAEEIGRVRRENANAVEKMLSDHESIGINMSEIIALGDWRLLFQARDLEAGITPEQVAAVAKRYFVRDNRTVGSFLPEDAPQRVEVPAAPTVAVAMEGFKPKALGTSAEVFDATPANIERRTVRSKVGGLDVAILSKQSRGESVSVVIEPRFGDQGSLNGKKYAATFAQMLLSHGTSKFTRAQLADEMSKLKMSGTIFKFDTTKANLPAAIALAAHAMQSPSYPQGEFEQLRKLIITSIESQRSEPTFQAANALKLHFDRYPKGDVRGADTLEQTLAGFNAVTLDEVKQFHKQFFGASQGQLTVVGDIDVATATSAIAQGFGKWNSASPYQRLNEAHHEVPAVRKTINTPDKENGVYMAQLNVALNENDADYPALVVANYLFGGSGMDSRLMQRIRQKDGLSYGAKSSLSADAFDRAGNFAIQVIAAPQNLGKVDVAVQEELARLIKDGFSAQEVARAKSGLLQQRAQDRTADGAVAARINQFMHEKRTFAWSQELDDKIAKLSPEQVNAAFKKAIDPAKLSVVIAADQAKAVAGAGAASGKAPTSKP